MEEILSQLNAIQERTTLLKENCKGNNLGLSFLSGFNLKKMREIYTRLLKQ